MLNIWVKGLSPIQSELVFFGGWDGRDSHFRKLAAEMTGELCIIDDEEMRNKANNLNTICNSCETIIYANPALRLFNECIGSVFLSGSTGILPEV